MISDGSRQSLQNIFSVLDTFASVSGLKVNYEKTEAMWIGALKDSTNTMFPEKKIKWSFDKVKALGVWFSAKNENINSINCREKVENLKNVLNSWQLRRLTLLGKIAAIKSPAASQMVYVLSSLSTCQDTLTEVNNLLYYFLWDGKGDKINDDI